MWRVKEIDELLLKTLISRAQLLVQDAKSPALSSFQQASSFCPAHERFIRLLRMKAGQFNLVGQLAKGNNLLVGEGNLSFALSLSGMKQIDPRKTTAPTFELEKDLSRKARNNAQTLRARRATVLHGVDAKNLRATLANARFDSLVFLFPNVASRIPVSGRNPNHHLVCKFLKSAARHLTLKGKIIIAAVNSPYYLGAFNFTDAARKSGYRTPDIYPFYPSKFVGYEHVMTDEEESSLERHDKFSLWVFQLK